MNKKALVTPRQLCRMLERQLLRIYSYFGDPDKDDLVRYVVQGISSRHLRGLWVQYDGTMVEQGCNVTFDRGVIHDSGRSTKDT